MGCLRFLKDNHRNALFRNVIGYIWKLEYSKLKGTYFHFVLLLEKSDLLLTDFIADKFGKFWVESVTNNQGSYLICKTGVTMRRSSGIGVITENENDVLRSLSGDLEYLMLKDFYFLPNVFVKDERRAETNLWAIRGLVRSTVVSFELSIQKLCSN